RRARGRGFLGSRGAGKTRLGKVVTGRFRALCVRYWLIQTAKIFNRRLMNWTVSGEYCGRSVAREFLASNNLQTNSMESNFKTYGPTFPLFRRSRWKEWAIARRSRKLSLHA